MTFFTTIQEVFVETDHQSHPASPRDYCWRIGLNPITLGTSTKTRDLGSTQWTLKEHRIHMLRRLPEDVHESRLMKGLILKLTNRLTIFMRNVHQSGLCSLGFVIHYRIITTSEESSSLGNLSARLSTDFWSRESWFSSIHEEGREDLRGLSQWCDVEGWKL